MAARRGQDLEDRGRLGGDRPLHREPLRHVPLVPSVLCGRSVGDRAQRRPAQLAAGVVEQSLQVQPAVDVEVRRAPGAHGAGELVDQRHHRGAGCRRARRRRRRARCRAPDTPCGPISSRTNPPAGFGVVAEMVAWLIAPPACSHVKATTPSGSPAASIVDDRAEGRVERVEHVRTEIEQPALLEAPRRPEEAARGGAVAEERRPPGGRAEPVGVAQERPHRRPVAVGEDELGHDAGVVDRRRQPLGLGQVERDRLLQQDGPPGAGDAGGELGLDVRRDGEGDGVAGVDELVDAGRGEHAVALRQPRGGIVTAGPDRGQLARRAGGEEGRREDRGPGSGTDQADAQRSGHPLVRTWHAGCGCSEHHAPPARGAPSRSMLRPSFAA